MMSLTLPKGDVLLIKGLFEKLGREKYLEAYVANKLPPGIEKAKRFDARIFNKTVGRAIAQSRRQSQVKKHMVFVTHDGGTPAPSGFGAVFTRVTKIDPQLIPDQQTLDKNGKPYTGPMRNAEYIGVHFRDGRPVWVEFRGHRFVPGRKPAYRWQEAYH